MPAAREPGSSLPVSSSRASYARSRASARACRTFASIPGVRDRVQDPPDRRGRRDAPDRAVQTSLVGQGLDVADGDGAVRERDGDVDQHPTGVVTDPAFPQAVGRLAQRAVVRPIRSASSASSTVPACDTTPVPSQVMTGTVLLVVGCTCEVPLLVGICVP